MNKKPIYITTTLPYANSNPHIGHFFEFALADAIVRFLKYGGRDVYFNIGLDEHGLKIQQAAEKDGITPKEYVDNLCDNWKEFIDKFSINSYDNFYRTSDPEHTKKVQKFWEESVERGDIYKKKYKGTYCVGCESFKTDRDLVDGKCPDHPTTELQEIEEENYFFKLSKYRNILSTWAYKAVDFIEPKSKRAEFLNFIDNIEDISISRVKDTVSWGVPVPGDDEQTIYVWFDALLNYIFAAGLSTDGHPHFDWYWKYGDVVQICGPDNLKFQAIIFQGLITSAAIKNSDKLLVHGTILDAEGKKMSKSVGNVVDPIDQLEKYGVDAVRYYALAGLRTYGNSSWSEERLVFKYNSDLADDYGNLVTRVVVLAAKGLDKFEDFEIDYRGVFKSEFYKETTEKIDAIKELWNNYLVSEALEATNKIVKELNKRIGDAEPWKDLENGWDLILELHWALGEINNLYYPVIPGKAGEVRHSLNECEKAIIFPKIELQTA